MAQSDFVFIGGEKTLIGSHGTHNYVFANGSPVNDDGDSTIVFESGTGLAHGNIVDDFEHNSLSTHYKPTSDMGASGFEIIDGASSSGSYSLHEHGYDNHVYSMPGDGLDNYPVRGDTIRFDWYDWGTTTSMGGITFGVQDYDTWYSAGLDRINGDIFVAKYDAGFVTVNRTSVGSFAAETWHTGYVYWNSPTIRLDAFGSSVSLSDSTWDSGGFGVQSKLGTPVDTSDGYEFNVDNIRLIN